MAYFPDSTAALCDEYELFLSGNPKVPPSSADEALCELIEQRFQLRERIQAVQLALKALEEQGRELSGLCDYLSRFCERWDVAQDRETAARIRAQEESI